MEQTLSEKDVTKGEKERLSPGEEAPSGPVMSPYGIRHIDAGHRHPRSGRITAKAENLTATYWG